MDTTVRLTKREMDVVQSFALGLSHEEVASKLGISKSGLRSHLENIYSKLGVRRIHQVIVWYFDQMIKPSSTCLDK